MLCNTNNKTCTKTIIEIQPRKCREMLKRNEVFIWPDFLEAQQTCSAVQIIKHILLHFLNFNP